MPDEEKAGDGKLVVLDKRSSAVPERLPQDQDNSPGALLRMALERNLDLDRIEKLMELTERWEANEARKAYVAAMSEFKKDPPIIVKDKHVSFRTDDGKLVEYDHESLALVVATCIKRMAEVGLHHDWIPSQTKDGLTITLRITHVLGHYEDKSLTLPIVKTMKMNQAQALKTACTYLERTTLLLGLGLAPADDDDGRKIPDPVEGTEEPPVDQDPDPSKRAEAAIKKYSKYLGAENARHDMEKFLGKVAGQWEDFEIGRLLETWQVVRACETNEEKPTALREAMFPTESDGQSDDEPSPPT